MEDDRNLYRDLGRRNKGLFWEYLSAYSFLKTKTPGTDYKIPLFLGYGSGEANNHCHNIGVIEDTKKLMIKEFNEGKYTEEFFNNLDKVYRSKLSWIKKISKEDFSKYNNIELVKVFDKVWKSMGEGNKPMLLGLKAQYLKPFFEEEVGKIIKVEKEILDAIALLLTPTKLTQVQIEEELLFNIEKEYNESVKEKSKESFLEFCKRKDVSKKLIELVDNAGWFHMEYINDPWDVEKYIEHLWDRIKVNTHENSVLPSIRLKETIKKQEEFFNKHQNSERLKKLSFVMKELSYILDASKAVVIEIRYRTLGLYDEITKRLDVNRRDLLQLSPPEIIIYLENKIKANKNIIAERWKHRAVWLHDSKIELFNGEEAKKLAEKLIEKSPETLDYAKGIVGYPGIVRGKVKIIHTIKDHDKFKEGDILVSHDVSTEFTSLLKKSLAIITDQGGIICHAAIVAREFKIPCIVGTKNASLLFKDGDYVEVDANKGIIRKIEE